MKMARYPTVAIGLIPPLLLACLFGARVAADQPVANDVLAKTIRQLGSASFISREDATQRLLFLGADAENALDEATKHGDREIRDRSYRVLKLIRKQQREAKLVAFRQGSQENAPESLPGWKQFSKRFGTEAAARDTYAQMLKDEWSFLEQFFATEVRDQQRFLTSRRYLLLQRSQMGYPNYSVGTMLTFFFLAAEAPDSFDHHPQLSSWVRHRALVTLLSPENPQKASAQGQLVRKMVGAWIVAASGPHLNDRLALQITVLYKLDDEGRTIAENVLKDNESLPLSKSMAMQAIVLRNDKSQSKLIEPYLKDSTLLSTTGTRQRQLRDIALACMMQLNGHDVTKIGVKPLTNTTHYAFDYNSLGFINDADRQRAFELFEQLQAQR